MERSPVAWCNVEELKAMIIACNGNVIGSNGRSLNKEQVQKYIRAYISIEQEN